MRRQTVRDEIITIQGYARKWGWAFIAWLKVSMDFLPFFFLLSTQASIPDMRNSNMWFGQGMQAEK